MKMTPATENDIAWILELENAPENRDFVWQGTEEEHLAEIQDPDSFLTIHRNEREQAVGYSLCRFYPDKKIMEIRRLVMKEKGQGYGRQAMKDLLRMAFVDKQAQRVWLDVYPYNTTGIALYESLGFQKEAHLRRSDYQRGQFLDQLIYGLLREEYLETLEK